MKKARFYGGLVGIICGYISAQPFAFLNWKNLFLWAAVGLLVGFIARDWHKAKAAGGFYGFFLTASFLIFGFEGSTDKIFGFILFSIGLSIIGVFCGILLGWIGHWIKLKIYPKK